MTSPFGPMVLICDARARRAARFLPEIEACLRERQLEYELRRTAGRGHAARVARETLGAGRRFLVAVGGDGTVHEVINGMIEDDRAVDPEAVFGVIAAGTPCDFIKTFGIPPTPGHAVAHLDGPERFPIDVGKVTYLEDGKERVSYFANIAQAGVGAKVTATAANLPGFLGPMVYLLALWLSLIWHKPADAKVDLVDRTYDGKMNNLVVANGQFFGGGMKVAPKAAPTDGLLDIQIEHASRREVIATIPRLYEGEHVPHPDVVEAKRVRCSITSDRPLLVEADGEVLGHTPATFEVLKSMIALKV